MRRLRDFQSVLLHVGDAVLPCRVVATGGQTGVLEPERPEQLERLPRPARASLVFDHGPHAVMLSGKTDDGPVPGTLAFWVTDAVQLRQLRLHPRLALAADVLVTPLDGAGAPLAPPRWHTTVDISACGALVADCHGPAGGHLGLELVIPTVPRAVHATARIVRVTRHGAALTFESIDPGLQAAIDRLIFTMRQRAARRVIERAPTPRAAFL